MSEFDENNNQLLTEIAVLLKDIASRLPPARAPSVELPAGPIPGDPDPQEETPGSASTTVLGSVSAPGAPASPAAVAMWDAINQFAIASGGRADVVSSERMAAVVAVSRAVDARIEEMVQVRLRNLVDPSSSMACAPARPVPRFYDLAIQLPIYEFPPTADATCWTQWDPLSCMWRDWSGYRWCNWESDAGSAPSDSEICRVVPRGEADASPMSRGKMAVE